jgi:hypothetical protein
MNLVNAYTSPTIFLPETHCQLKHHQTDIRVTVCIISAPRADILSAEPGLVHKFKVAAEHNPKD